ncbi:T9SS type A sorting domain-containing protein [Chryseobacterium sp. c4a]|uniref:T9SS type A sorting domain-containing protein n=1 Tax=Chryseobacterium sp. c4a TaxID=1573582 RepID=UPI00135B3B5A|nr:T9SS type A sorting domain-containing protein [Chryseobacterium sp. c4a]
MKKTFLQQGIMHKALLFTLLFLTGILSYAQDKVYASSQTNQVNGLCLICGVQNPENAVGSNEDNYSAFRIGLDANATVNQTLIFPASVTQYYAKIVIGIGAGMDNLSTELLKGVSIETFLGNISNNDKMGITGDILKISSNPKRGTVEFTPKKAFDRIKISLKNNGTLNLDDRLRIYYAYHIPSDYTTCNPPPFKPLIYIPFDGNTKMSPLSLGYGVYSDLPSIPDLPITYRNNMACGNSLYSFGITEFNNGGLIADPDSTTIAFWAQSDANSSDPRLNVSAFVVYFSLTKDNIKFRPVVGKFDTAPITIVPNSANQLSHYVITRNVTRSTKEITTCLYKNGHKISSSSTTYTSEFPPYNTERNISMLDTQIDEYLLYKEALTEDQVLELYCSYSKSQGCSPSSGLAPATESKITSENEQLIISPNPTTGQITLDGNVLMIDADIAITNTSGKEVYHSKYSSKTFDLPATLPGGVYILTLKTKQGRSYSKKVLLTR